MTILAGAITAAQVVMYGALLGVGFWASKKVTNRADEWLLKWDIKRNGGNLPEGVLG